MSNTQSAAPAVAVVICAYTEARWNALREAIASVQRQTVRPVQCVLVVDYNPRLLERARRELTGVTIVENSRERGLSGARNTGIWAVNADVVAFLDDDAVASPTWVEDLAAWYRNPRVLGVGGAIEPIWEAARPSWFPDELGWVVGCSYRGQPTSIAVVRNLIGANMSFRRQALIDVDGFRTDVGQVGAGMLRCDDTELCIRIARAHPEQLILHDPAVSIRHRVTPQRATWAYYRERCFTEGLAKALIVRLVGQQRGLAAERTYAMQTLPTGVLRCLLEGLVHPGGGGFSRAGAICVGFALTVAGYLAGRLGIFSVDRSRTAAPVDSSGKAA